ncbi:CopG family transcriptional regulator [Leeia sp. TBRC 13508]|uniref:CopG family transcriptional regulator n=1 Tax=Leeia speluncae TaxID=2884804 RepID=A0ABS8DAB3_9NEIS|nr:DUF411 domain-containing protein [Leeia speluncae]MCB6184548.1 CopG family transcriptional regulator [Leeia speluncae]
MKKALSFVAALLISTSAFSAINATVYKDPYCGCCEAYIAYLQQHGFTVTAVNRNDMAQLKNQLGVKTNEASCHTMKIGNYIVEGHVPVKAIQKMLKDKPSITGITVPGMPANSPGMGVEKPGTLAVFEINAKSVMPKLYGKY